MSNKKWSAPEGYYEDVARSEVNPLLHKIGTKLTAGVLYARHGSVVVNAPNSVVDLESNAIVSITHRSALDIPVFVHATERVGLRHTRPIAKDSLFRSAPLGWLFHQLGAFAVDRDAPDYEGISLVQQTQLERGENIGIFTEGFRVHHDVRKVAKLKRGVSQIASITGVPVVPLAIAGVATELGEDGKVMDRDVSAPFGFRGLVVASFGEPIYFDRQNNASMTPRESLRQAREQSAQIQASMQAELDRAYFIRDAGM